MQRVAAFALLAACSNDVPDRHKSCEPEIEACDVLETDCQAALTEALSCISNLDAGAAPPEVQVWSSQQIDDWLESSELSAEEALHLQHQLDALVLFRLVPLGLSAEQVAQSYGATLPAFYDPDTGEIVLVDRRIRGSSAGAAAPPPLSGAWVTSQGMEMGMEMEADPPRGDDEESIRTVAHELAHAIRDRTTGLHAFYGRATSRDAWLAARGVVEGEAQLYAELAWLEANDLSLEDVQWEQMLQRAKERSLAAFIVIQNPYLLADRFLPYPYGYAYVFSVWEEGGSGAVDALYEDPPQSTRQLTAGYGARLPPDAGEALATSDDAVPELPDRFEQVGTFTLGVWLVDALIQRFLPRPKHDLSWDLLSKLEGDVLTLFHDPMTDGPLSVWRMRFGDEAAATAMAERAPWPEHIAVLTEGRDVLMMAYAQKPDDVELASLDWVSQYAPTGVQGAAPPTRPVHAAGIGASPHTSPARLR